MSHNDDQKQRALLPNHLSVPFGAVKRNDDGAHGGGWGRAPARRAYATILPTTDAADPNRNIAKRRPVCLNTTLRSAPNNSSGVAS